MGELGSIWLYQREDVDLKQTLQSTRMELEEMRLEVNAAKEQTREKERQLHSLLQIACRERNEAREQLHNLFLILNNNTTLLDESNIFVEPPKIQYPRANSSITESITLSDPFSNSYISSSPVDSVFDAAMSPEFSMPNYHDISHSGTVVPGSAIQFDSGTVVIDELVRGKVLPRKGKLLEAVMEAGPLLQTLMLAGPLPSWRNPLPVQSFEIPQVTVAMSTPFSEMSCSSSCHMGTNPMISYSNGNVQWGSADMNNQILCGKRQRLI